MADESSEYTISPKLNELIKAIYLGPLEENLWQTFLNLYRQAVNANYATLLLRPPRMGDSGVVLNAVINSSDVLKDYNDNYFALDPFVDLPAGRVFTLQEFLSPQEIENSEYYQSYTRPIDVFHIMGVDMSEPDGLKARLRVTRGQAAANFGDKEKTLTSNLVDHLQQAIHLHSCIARTESERVFYEETINHLETGTLILDENAKILRANQAATKLLEEKQGLRVLKGSLQVGNRETNLQFRKLLDEALSAHRLSIPGFIKAIRVNKTDSLSSLGLLIRPMPMVEGADGHANPSVAIFISDPEKRRHAPTEILHQLFEFTPAEGSLALLLANGLTLDEAANELGITRNTAKSHLSSVFSKTGVTRQPKLVQLILKSVASMG